MGTSAASKTSLELELKFDADEEGRIFSGSTYTRMGNSVSRTIQRKDGVLVNSTQVLSKESMSKNDEERFDLSWLRAQKSPFTLEHPEEVRIADLFCGCGGMSLGIMESCRALNKRPVIGFACDLEPTYLDVYSCNLRPEVATGAPIETIFDSQIGSRLSATERKWRKKLGTICVAAGGPPCQGHSDLNNYTRRNDPRNSLYLRMARFAEVIEPEHLIIENVLGVRHDKGGVFDQTVDALRLLGYHVDTPIVRAEEIGVPQRRHRAFIVASRSIKLHQGFFDRALKKHRVPERSVGWACNDLMEADPTSALNQSSELSLESRRRVDWLFQNDAYDLPDSLRPSCHRDKDHSYKSVYGRLYWDQPAWTITTGFLVMGQGRFIHPKQRRVITPHEGARLQFFPDFFDFGERTRKEYAKMIGNAVPPKMAYVIALELLK